MSTSLRNNVLAGSFLILALVLAVWASFQLSGEAVKDARRPYVARFSIAEGATGIKKDSEVLLGGQRVGTVVSTGFFRHTPAPVEGKPQPERFYVDVLFRVRDDLALHPDAGVYLDRPLLGSLSTISIADVGAPGGKASGEIPRDPSPLASGVVVLAGHVAPPAALQQAGIGPEQSRQIRQIIDNFNASAEMIRQFVDGRSDDLNAMVRDAKATLEEIKGRLPEWMEETDKVLANLARASEKFEPTMASAESGAKRLDSMLERNEGAVDETIANVRSITAKIDAETLREFTEALTGAREAFQSLQASLGRADEAVGEVRGFLSEDLDQVRTALANFRLTSEQLKLLSVEVRQQPWRLLYRPDQRESDLEILYDSSRAYGEAVSDLRASIQSLSGAKRAGAPADRLDRLAAEVEGALQRARAAEEAFLTRLMGGK